MTEPDPDPLFPDPHALADDEDELDWDVDAQGRMVAAAAPDDAVVTVPFESDEVD